jgi:hypothetical protein|tara:strand:- start:78 stop:266 length:189 start_codon:yes stop_codon:yes gene_type:complete
MTTYTYKNITYQIVITDEWDRCRQREEQILKDFQHCEKTGDFLTIKNRMTNGIKWGWLIKIK